MSKTTAPPSTPAWVQITIAAIGLIAAIVQTPKR